MSSAKKRIDKGLIFIFAEQAMKDEFGIEGQ